MRLMFDEAPFVGFPENGLRFLSGLKKNNNKEWFDARKETYREGVAEPAQAFVVALGRRLQTISKGIIYDTRLNGGGSVMRVYRDIRFSKDKTPYKDWLGIFFWEGKAKKMVLNLGWVMYMMSSKMGLILFSVLMQKATHSLALLRTQQKKSSMMFVLKFISPTDWN